MKKSLLAFGFWLLAIGCWAQTLAFPTAEGFGKYASGGRGGKVVEVTTLADTGEGSLRWALTEAGRENATIVFRVSGIIDIGPNPQRKSERSIRAKLKNVTIAGQAKKFDVSVPIPIMTEPAKSTVPRIRSLYLFSLM